MKAANKQLAEWDKELDELHGSNGDLGLKVQMLEQELKEVQRDREANKNSAPTVAKFPEPADLLNQLMAKYEKKKAEGMKPKKPTASLADIEGILELLVGEP
ncbi:MULTISPECIES: flagellar alpha dynein [unclassified Microcoleus]|uniref:flagellar alpha dynein n=1 Tax=unclassified Microcoleus TaxID=2642155 RepID=UPI002FD537DD